MSNWETPKTDWKPTDYVNAVDFNRIVSNLKSVFEKSLKLFPTYSIQSISADKSFTSFAYAEDVNAIESNLDTINKNTLDLKIGEKQTYYANQSTIDYVELNRIENATLELYEPIDCSVKAMPRLSFKLGNKRGIRI